MQQIRPFVLSVAGFDPSSGAGLSADLKTFEQLRVHGLAICTSLTLQTEDKFHSIEWRKLSDVLQEIAVLLATYDVKSVKIGIVPSFYWVNQIAEKIKTINPKIKIVLDPVCKTSTGFALNDSIQNEELIKALSKIDLITPNNDEINAILPDMDLTEKIDLLKKNTVLLIKNYFLNRSEGTDVLIEGDNVHEIHSQLANYYPKHGSGCVFSSAVAANLALQNTMFNSCVMAKRYVEQFLNSNKTKLGYHAV